MCVRHGDLGRSSSVDPSRKEPVERKAVLFCATFERETWMRLSSKPRLNWLGETENAYFVFLLSDARPASISSRQTRMNRRCWKQMRKNRNRTGKLLV